MPIHTRRWDDPPLKDEGLRILITRYRPRGVTKSGETWDKWMPNLGPSKELHAAAYAKVGLGISWEIYRSRYLTENLRDSNDARMRVGRGGRFASSRNVDCRDASGARFRQAASGGGIFVPPFFRYAPPHGSCRDR